MTRLLCLCCDSRCLCLSATTERNTQQHTSHRLSTFWWRKHVALGACTQSQCQCCQCSYILHQGPYTVCCGLHTQSSHIVKSLMYGSVEASFTKQIWKWYWSVTGSQNNGLKTSQWGNSTSPPQKEQARAGWVGRERLLLPYNKPSQNWAEYIHITDYIYHALHGSCSWLFSLGFKITKFYLKFTPATRTGFTRTVFYFTKIGENKGHE